VQFRRKGSTLALPSLAVRSRTRYSAIVNQGGLATAILLAQGLVKVLSSQVVELPAIPDVIPFRRCRRTPA
jgi:hypothetical protein